MLKFAGVALAVLGAFLAGCSGNGEKEHGSHDHGSGSMDADGSHGDHHESGTADSAGAGAGEMNKLCPVMGDEADPEITIVHNGKKVAFCCDDCIEKFQKEPEKYFAIAYPDASGR